MSTALTNAQTRFLRGQAHGSWECTIRFTQTTMQGGWTVAQVTAP